MEGGLHFIRFSTPHCTGIEKTVTTWHLQRVRGGVVLFNFFYERHSTTLPVCKFLRHIFFFLPTTQSVIRISTPRIVVCFAQSITTFTTCYRVFFRSFKFHYVPSRGCSSLRAIAWCFLSTITTCYRVVFHRAFFRFTCLRATFRL